MKNYFVRMRLNSGEPDCLVMVERCIGLDVGDKVVRFHVRSPDQVDVHDGLVVSIDSLVYISAIALPPDGTK